jgi:hypothetical protein
VADFVIRTGDQAMWNPSFPPAVVTAPPGVITGSSKSKVGGQIACVAGDEATVIVAGAVYISGAFATPGTGTLTIESLGSDQQATKGKSGSLALILKGSLFRARFQVTSPAVNPNSGVPDPTPQYSGTGQWITSNAVTKAT